METVIGVFATRERGSPGAANHLERSVTLKSLFLGARKVSTLAPLSPL